MVLSVNCHSCKNETDLTINETHPQDPNILTKDNFCINCNSLASIRAKRGMIFMNIDGNRIITKLGSYTW